MRSILISIVILSFMFSCNSKDEVLGTGKDENESFSFLKIEYNTVNDESRRTFMSFEIPLVEYLNNSNREQTYPFDPFTGYNETSNFVSEDFEAFIIEDIELFVPVYIDENNTISLGDRKWKYSCVVQQRKSAFNFTKDIIIPPYNKLIINTKLFFKKYKTNYKLFMRNNKTDKERIIEGTWTGIYPDYLEINTSFSDL